MKILCTLFVFVFAFGVFADAGNVLKASYSLNLKDSISSIPKSAFVDTNLYTQVSGRIQGTFNNIFVKDTDLYLAGYENSYAPAADTFPQLITYNISGDQFVELSRVYCRPNTGLSNTVVSSNKNRLYGASSTYASILPGNPSQSFVTHFFKVEIHPISADGILSQTPSIVFDLKQLDAAYYDQTIAYNGIGGISSDAKYILVTYATGVGIPGILTGQKFEVLELSDDLTTLTSVAKANAPPTNVPGTVSFPQGSVMWPKKGSSTKYNIISAMASWNFSYPFGLDANMAYYVFDSENGTLELKATVPLPAYPQGYDVDEENGFVYAVTNEVSDGISARQDSPQPFGNDAEDKNYEFRVMELKENQETLVHVGGIDLEGAGIQVRSSHDGKTVAVTTSSSSLFNYLVPNPGDFFSPVARIFSPSIVNLYKRSGSKLELTGSSVSASPLSFGLAWTADDSRLAVSGQATYLQVGTQTTGQKSDQLYEVIKNS